MSHLVSGSVPLVSRVALIPILPLAVGECQEVTTTNDTAVLRKRASTLFSIFDQSKTSSPTSKSSSDFGFSLQRDSDSLDDRLMHRYRCEILAASSKDHVSAEAECKQLVVEAGGTILDHIRYPGGFLFDMSYLNSPPLETGDETAEGGSIVVDMVEKFFLSSDIEQSKPTNKKRSDFWRIKSERRLQKKQQMTGDQQAIGCCSMRFGPAQLTLSEFLVAETIERRSHETEWMTVSDGQE